LYTAWFRDTLVQPDDEDFEWPGCFLVAAADASAAKAWGDHLTLSFSHRRGSEQFLWSKVERTAVSVAELPLIEYGREASDEEIGW